MTDSGIDILRELGYDVGMATRLLLLDNEDSFTHLLADRLRAAGSLHTTILPERQARSEQLSAFDALIISPGPGLPHEHPASVRMLEEAVRRRIPCLGICLGFQMQALHFGGQLMQLPEPRHGQAKRINLAHNRLCSSLPLCTSQPISMQVGLYHSWAVSATPWPAELRLLACDDEGVPMALEHRTLPLWGFQFHPESILSPEGTSLLRGFLTAAARSV